MSQDTKHSARTMQIAIGNAHRSLNTAIFYSKEIKDGSMTKRLENLKEQVGTIQNEIDTKLSNTQG